MLVALRDAAPAFVRRDIDEMKLDAKTGLIEAGYVRVEDMLSRQPWPEPGDEFPVYVRRQRAARRTP